jgi:glycosyltransferase involved in cell wall biosynthesis
MTNRKISILHITNDYSGSTVYKNLVSKLDRLGVAQIVYNPIRRTSLTGKNSIDFETKNSEIIYANILSKYTDRIYYRGKIHKILRDIEAKIDLKLIDIIHAHTWYSDGGVAYLLHEKYNIPYIVTIRNTDLNIFQKYLIHERSFGSQILIKAENVIVISASYKNRLLKERSIQKIKIGLVTKLKIIPNGVDDFWIENAVEKKKLGLKTPVQCLFVGKFTRGKNIIPLQMAINKINIDGVKIQLHLIGGGGKVHKKVMEVVKQNPLTMIYHGKIYELELVKKHFEMASIFAMPSKRETFGLVYVEAMLQGLPILYSSNEGIDGLYVEKIGEKVSSSGVEEIKQKLLLMIEHFDYYEIPILNIIKNHSWHNIAQVFYSIYTRSQDENHLSPSIFQIS